MGDIIRESATMDPISVERVDMDQNIHRFNFGWMVRRVVVSIGDTEVDGIQTENSLTQISGTSHVYNEQVTEEILPAKLEIPEGGDGEFITTTIDDPLTLKTYTKNGNKIRTAVRSHIFGGSEIIALGSSQFNIVEKKSYADAIGDGDKDEQKGLEPDENDVPDTKETADGGGQVTAANGVLTVTKVQG